MESDIPFRRDPNAIRSGSTSIPGAISDLIGDTISSIAKGNRMKGFNAILQSRLREAEHRVASTLHAAKSDPNAIKNRIGELASTVAGPEGLVGKGTAMAALINGGDYRTIVRPIFVPELADTQRTKVFANGAKIYNDAVSYFKKQGLSSLDAQDLVDEIVHRGANHQSPGKLTGPKKAAIEKTRKQVPPELDALYGRLDNQRDVDAMTLSRVEHLIESRRMQKEMVEDLTERGLLHKSNLESGGWSSFDGTRYTGDPKIIEILNTTSEPPKGILSYLENSPVFRVIDSTLRNSLLFGTLPKHAVNMVGSVVHLMSFGVSNPKHIVSAIGSRMKGVKDPDYDFAVKNGVVQRQGYHAGGSAKVVLGRGKGAVERFTDKAGGVLASPSTAVENVARFAHFKDGVEYLGKVYPTWNRGKCATEAAKRTIDAFPTTDMTYGVIRELPRSIRGFPTFAFEAGIRNPLITGAHLWNDIRSAKTAPGKLAAWKKLSQFAALYAMAPVAVQELSSKLNNVTDEERDAVRGQAGFNGNSAMWFYRGEDGKVNGVPFGRIIPSAYIYEVMSASTRTAKDIDERIGRTTAATVGPLVGGAPAVDLAKKTMDEGATSLPKNVVSKIAKGFDQTKTPPLSPVVDKTTPNYAMFDAIKYAKNQKKIDLRKFKSSAEGIDALRELFEDIENNDDAVIEAIKQSTLVGKQSLSELRDEVAKAGYDSWEIAHLMRGERIPRDFASFEIEQRLAPLYVGSESLRQLRDKGVDVETKDTIRSEVGEEALAKLDHRLKIAGKVRRYLSKMRQAGQEIDQSTKEEIIADIESAIED